MRNGANRDEVEFLKGELRQAKKVIAHLKKELARANKLANRAETLVETFVPAPEPEERVDESPQIKCPECKSSKVQVAELGRQGTMITCSKCGYRKRKKT